MVEASYDLYASPWRTFRQITFPQLLPAIVAGFLLAFTFSFDDYVITSFVSGPGSSTLPIFIFGQVKRGVTPETNAVATMMLVFTLLMLAAGPVRPDPQLASHRRRQGWRDGRDDRGDEQLVVVVARGADFGTGAACEPSRHDAGAPRAGPSRVPWSVTPRCAGWAARRVRRHPWSGVRGP